MLALKRWFLDVQPQGGCSLPVCLNCFIYEMEDMKTGNSLMMFPRSQHIQGICNHDSQVLVVILVLWNGTTPYSVSPGLENKGLGLTPRPKTLFLMFTGSSLASSSH